jgi:hypothetical protein
MGGTDFLETVNHADDSYVHFNNRNIYNLNTANVSPTLITNAET